MIVARNTLRAVFLKGCDIIKVTSVELSIDECEAELSEIEITAAAIFFAKMSFLIKNNADLTLGQVPYLFDSLPDSVFWDEITCGECEERKGFTDKEVPDWSYDEKAQHWVCPECIKNAEDDDEDPSRISDIAEEASEKADIIIENSETDDDDDDELDEEEIPYEDDDEDEDPTGGELVEDEDEEEGIGIMPRPGE